MHPIHDDAITPRFAIAAAMTMLVLIAAPATAQLFTETQAAVASPAPTGPPGGPVFRAVAIDGDVMVQGAYQANSVTQQEGAVYVFERNSGGTDNWGQVKELIASDPSISHFGWSVAVAGDTVFVGARLDPAVQGYGAVYVFERDQGGADNWGQTKKIVSSHGADSVRFGRTIAAEGNRLVVGARSGPDSAQGSVYVHERDQGGADNWGETAYLTNSDGTFSDEFGWSVDIHGDRIAIGAKGHEDTTAWNDNYGAVYIFEYDPGVGTWTETRKINSATSAGYELGTSVSLFHDWVLAGAPGGDRANLYWIHAGGHYTWGLARTFESPAPSVSSYGAEVNLEYPLAVVGDTFSVVDVFRADIGGWPWSHVQSLTASDGILIGGTFQKLHDLDGGHFAAAALGVVASPYGEAAYVFDAPTQDLTVVKDDGSDWTTPWAEITYEITATNNGSSTIAATLRDDLDPAFFCCGTWICAPTPGSGAGTGCPASGDTDSLRAGVPINLEAGDSVVLLATATPGPPQPGGPNQSRNTVTLEPPAWLVDVDPDDNVSTDINQVRLLDFGDAPLSYPQGGAPDYARHGIEPGLQLGVAVDDEIGSQPDAMALGDDSAGIDDEDGVVFTSVLGAGASAALDVTASASGLLNAWCDFNADGDWTDLGEQVFTDTPLTAGVNSLLMAVPGGATIGQTFTRFRFDTTGGLSPDGAATVGEIEDHQVEIIAIGADLSLTAQIPAPWAPDGQSFSYTVNVANAGPETATGVSLTDTLPTQTVFLSATAGCVHTSGVVDCALSNIASGSNASVVVDVAIPAGTIGPLSNTASVAANEVDGAPSNNTETVVTPVFLFTDGFESGDLSGWSP